MAERMSDSSSYQKVHDGLLRMHQLFVDGKRNSVEVKAIRDATDEPWNELSEEDRRSIQGLSQDLYELEGVKPKTPGTVSPLDLEMRVVEAVKARDEGQSDRALELLRTCHAYTPMSRVSYLRGSIWLLKKDLKTAVVFFKHAVDQDPTNDYLRSAWLHCLKTACPDEARVEAAKVLEASESFAPSVVVYACEIEFSVTTNRSDIDSLPVYEQLIPVLEATLKRIEKASPPYPRSLLSMAISLLAACNEHLQYIDQAFYYYSVAIKLDPKNSALLVARGKLMYGDHPSALTDFRDAIRLGTPLVWPYFFLAHYHIGVNQHLEARELSEEGLRRRSTERVRSELYEFRAIAELHLGFPENMARRTFEEAIRTDVTNERAIRNLTIFEQLLKTRATEIKADVWETPTKTAMRGHARDVFSPAFVGCDSPSPTFYAAFASGFS